MKLLSMQLYCTIILQITVEYNRTPPQIFISQLRQFVRDHQHPPGCHLTLEWVKAPEEPAAEEELLRTDHGNLRKTRIYINTAVHKVCLLHSVPTPKGIQTQSPMSRTMWRQPLSFMSVYTMCHCFTPGLPKRFMRPTSS